MPKLEPFKGILYNPKNVDISSVVAPPYDVILPQMQDELYRASEYNIVRLILGKEETSDSNRINKYTRTRQFFDNWLRNKILVQDGVPAMYIYSQEYFHPAPLKYSKVIKKNLKRCGVYENRKKIRIGFIARMKIEDPHESRVLPHEYTFVKPKEDRLNLLREVKANLCPIFGLFQDEDNRIMSILKTVVKQKPIFDIIEEGVSPVRYRSAKLGANGVSNGVRHKFWRLTKKALIKKIQDAMLDKDIFIADGHHRYEVAVLYRNEMRARNQKPVTSNQKNKGYDYVMMYFSPMNDEGLTILSTHRMIKNIDMKVEEILDRLKAYFYVEIFRSYKDMFKKMASAKKGQYLFGMYCRNKTFYLLKLEKEAALDELIKEDRSSEWKKLDVTILHSLILSHILGLRGRIQEEGNIIYTRDADFAIAEVNRGNCEVAFFLNPTEVTQVRDVARKGDKMPHKSTYFYPKLLSGLVINKLE